MLPRYDRSRSYEWNYDHAPDPIECAIPAMTGDWKFCGLPVASPVGMPAGPLLNSRWVLYYASLGFDVLTYKTVRSSARAAYPLPNLLPVQCGQLTGVESRLPSSATMQGSWAISFGMPSKSPSVWRVDVETAKSQLDKGKLLCVSVVGTMQAGWSSEDLANDYAQCAAWAVSSGADAVEANFSCPNVSTCDGQLYQDFAAARLVAQTLRSKIGRTPLMIKIGHVAADEEAMQLIEAVADVCDGLAMTNCVSTTVADQQNQLLFDGQKRGIGGTAIRISSLDQIARFKRLLSRRREKSPVLIGVGGVSSSQDMIEYLNAGASSVHIATAAMLEPKIAIKIRSEWPVPGHR